MMGSKWLCAALVGVLALTGLLPAWSAVAQAQQTSTYQQPAASAGTEPTEGHRTGTYFLNAVYMPGKAIICASGTVAATALMLLTFGSAYRTAVRVFEEGCHGTWILTPGHVSGKIPPDHERN